MNEPNKAGYWWHKDDEGDGIWLVMQNGRITDGAFIYGHEEFDGEWIPVKSPEEIDVALEQARRDARYDAYGNMLDAIITGWRERYSEPMTIGEVESIIRMHVERALEQARAEERERASQIRDALEHLLSVSDKMPGVAPENWLRAIRKARQATRETGDE